MMSPAISCRSTWSGGQQNVVSERLGNSPVAFTLDTYAHVMSGMHPEAAERLVTLVFGEVDDAADASAADDEVEEDDPEEGNS